MPPCILQEYSTPRPVILKSDRESREHAKEKQEKEKQPTIILKTREQSTPKEDRPRSPKSSKPLAEESTIPSKIAQNENKEKRNAGMCFQFSKLRNHNNNVV